MPTAPLEPSRAGAATETDCAINTAYIGVKTAAKWAQNSVKSRNKSTGPQLSYTGNTAQN